MNKLTIIGNLTSEPVSRVANTANGQVNVATFSIAVNDRKGNATFFNCTAWRGLADIVTKYCHKGKKVGVIGAVGCHTYTAKDGTSKASLDVIAEEIDLLSAAEKAESSSTPNEQQTPSAPNVQNYGTPVDYPDEFPW